MGEHESGTTIIEMCGEKTMAKESNYVFPYY